jgi:protein-S-isoprenylcysteine O-methyltransferase Ste14
MSVQAAVNMLWLVWYVTWIAAVVWSSKTTRQMRSDMGGLHRLFSFVGAILLFIPSGPGGPFRNLPILGLFFERLWLAPPWVSWSLFTLVASAFAFCWWARLHLGRLWSGFVTLKEGHRIVDTGPYGLVRHPIYTGVIAAAVLTAAIRADLAAMLGSGLIALGFSMTARIEEGFLSAQLGPHLYEPYRKKVPMIVPRLG